jgi:glucokinase-like ROK family protein
VGLPGPVEFTTGRPVAPPIMPGWDDYPVRERFSTRFGAPVWVDNDVNVMALGERAEGAARGVDDIVFVKIGTGIGGGIISHGRLQRGAQGSAGDVGHIQVVSDTAVLCRCGNVGCLEAVAGGAALGRAAEGAAREGESRALADMLTGRGALTASDVAEAARHGDPVSTRLLQQAGRQIGQMLATMVNILNPSLIVIGGGVAAAGDVLMASIREVVYGRSLPLATRHLQIRQSTLGERAGVVGLAAMVLDELFVPERVAAWVGSVHRLSGRPLETAQARSG